MPKDEDETRANAAHAMYGDNSEYEAAGKAVYNQGVGMADIHGWEGLPEDVKAYHRNTARIAFETHNAELIRARAAQGITVNYVGDVKAFVGGGGSGGGTASTVSDATDEDSLPSRDGLS